MSNTNKKTVIMVSGKRTCGKDTITGILNKIAISKGLSVSTVSFAGFFKECYCDNTGAELNRLLTDYKYKEDKRSDMLQYFTKIREEKGHDFFCNKVIDNITKSNFDICVISDLRLTNDLKIISKYNDKINFILIRVNSKIESRKKRGWTHKECDNDPTETDLDTYDKFDKIFDNDGTIEDLEIVVKKWFDSIVI